MELDKCEKNRRHKPQTLVRSVVRKRQIDELSPPRCVKTLAGFMFSDKDGHELTGSTCLTVPTEETDPAHTLHLSKADKCLKDVSDDGVLISPLNETILAEPSPPIDPLTIKYNSIQMRTPIGTEDAYLPSRDSGNLPMIPQTQENILDVNGDNDDHNIISDNDISVTSNASELAVEHIDTVSKL